MDHSPQVGESFTVFSGFADGAEVGSVVVTLVDGSRLTARVIDDSWSIIRGASDESGADLVSIDFLSLDGTLVETVDVQADLAAAGAVSPVVHPIEPLSSGTWPTGYW